MASTQTTEWMVNLPKLETYKKTTQIIHSRLHQECTVVCVEYDSEKGIKMGNLSK